MVILVVYMDDIIMTGTNSNEISALKSFFDEQFKIKDLGCLNYFFGVEVCIPGMEFCCIIRSLFISSL